MGENGGSGGFSGGNGSAPGTDGRPGGIGGNGYYLGKCGASNFGDNGLDGSAITTGVMTSSFPLNGMTPTTSIVIIEAGDSIEDF